MNVANHLIVYIVNFKNGHIYSKREPRLAGRYTVTTTNSVYAVSPATVAVNISSLCCSASNTFSSRDYYHRYI